MTDFPSLLTLLRQRLSDHSLDYYLVPSSDPHQSEYLPACWERRQFISQFTGSAGTALIGQQDAYLWTDSRYFLQAEQELNSAIWALMKQGIDPSLEQWLTHLNRPIRLGVDPHVLSTQEAQQLEQALDSNDGTLVFLTPNWIDEIWDNQPQPPREQVTDYEAQAGQSTLEKLKSIRQILKQSACQSLVVSRLDSIAWLLNIRGQDIQYNPLCISHLIITASTGIWFVAPEKVSDDLANRLKTVGIDIQPYNQYLSHLKNMPEPVWLDPQGTNAACAYELKDKQQQHQPCPIYAAKSIKNKTEIHDAQQAHIADGLALCDFFHWLEQQEPNTISEWDAAMRVLAARQKQSGFQEPSFPSISAYGKNGAVIHYQPSPTSSKLIGDQAIYLLDSGGQYLGGTTDVTRCTHLGEPTKEDTYHYTLVLKAHLSCRHALFPANTGGDYLDFLTRQALWRAGYDYGHGTGHGVGSFLCVHEGPQRISKGRSDCPLSPGMIVSNEPGLYIPQSHGIRIENLCLITHHELEKTSTNTDYFTLKDLTCFPYERKLIDTKHLTASEIKQINGYHAWVWQTLSPLIEQAKQREWLKEKTRALPS